MHSRPRAGEIDSGADIRRRRMLDAAVQAFARGGYHGATTAEVARYAGVSQPRIIQVFGTKLELFLEAHRYAGDLMLEAFAANLRPPFDAQSVGRTYTDLVMRRPELSLMIFNAFTAADEPRIAQEARRLFLEIVQLLREQGGAGDQELSAFLARGMLINAALAMQLLGREGETDWAPFVFGLPASVAGDSAVVEDAH
ncbi:TetR/AcrR family transcriptional regulator [Flexivirga sp. ID2601S]|uniref:TetR/AcrR family transcriptional regulator n=1 Tax=Flexivirga aerilata TaxID=1656889 RepID=A0A849AHJ0_9MICO|nr:TetR/AcrR family transcriptional regulator [Flexivirga aerilata]NNG37900.1 TetR/AcrR family transcriptional regulator [Flexivirga aerilata]